MDLLVAHYLPGYITGLHHEAESSISNIKRRKDVKGIHLYSYLCYYLDC
jgi:hypothetical protein